MSQQNFGPPEPSAYPNLQAGQQPPQYQAPPPAGFAPQPPPVAATVIVGAVPMGQDPQQMNCPACHSNVITETSPTPGLLTYLISGVLCLFG